MSSKLTVSGSYSSRSHQVVSLGLTDKAWVYIYLAGGSLEKFLKQPTPALHPCLRQDHQIIAFSSRELFPLEYASLSTFSPIVATIEDRQQLRVRFDPFVLLQFLMLEQMFFRIIFNHMHDAIHLKVSRFYD